MKKAALAIILLLLPIISGCQATHQMAPGNDLPLIEEKV